MSEGNPSNFMLCMIFVHLLNVAFVSILTYIFVDKTIAYQVVHNKQFHHLLDIQALPTKF